MNYDVCVRVLFCIALGGMLLPMSVGCVGTQPPPSDCCLISENGGEGLRRVSFASGEEIFLEAASFDTSSLTGLPQKDAKDKENEGFCDFRGPAGQRGRPVQTAKV